MRFPFTDLRSSKHRPAVVLSSEAFEKIGQDFLIAAVSGQRVDRPGPFDHSVMEWEGASLLMPSVVRAGKLVTLDRQLIRRPLGSLTPADLAAVEHLVRGALAL